LLEPLSTLIDISALAVLSHHKILGVQGAP
jgi:hypothetical protein